MKDREPGPNPYYNSTESLVEAIRSAPRGSQEKWRLMDELARLPAPLSHKAEEDWYTSRIMMIGGAFVLLSVLVGIIDHFYPATMSAPSVVRAAAITLPAQAPRQESSAVLLPESVRQVEKYIQDYQRLDRWGNSLENAKREWKVFYTPQNANLKTSTNQGIWVHDFPNKDENSSRSIPTNGPGTGPTWKAWYWGHPIPGSYNIFVAEYNKGTAAMAVWATRSTSEGGWGPSPYLPVHKQPHSEFWRVFTTDDPERWFVTIEVNGRQISGEEFLAHTLPLPLFGR